MTVYRFPKYLIMYIGTLDENGLMEHPLKKQELAIDITCFAEKGTLEKG